MIPPSLRLRRAILASDPTLVSRLLTSHPSLLHNPDFSSHGLSNTNLHLAASHGHLEIVQLLLVRGHERHGISLNEDHQTPLMLASIAGHAETVHAICTWDGYCGEESTEGKNRGESGNKDGEKENDGATGSRAAARGGAGGGVGRRDRWGRDAVMYASRGGWDTALQILLTFAPPPTSSLSPLSSLSTSPSAVFDNSSSAAAALLQNADVDGNTALHFASSNGHLLVLRTLLAAGADADRRNVWSWTAMSYSATVAAEVYFKGLVAEMERRKGVRREAIGAGKGGAVRLVRSEGGEG